MMMGAVTSAPGTEALLGSEVGQRDSTRRSWRKSLATSFFAGLLAASLLIAGVICLARPPSSDIPEAASLQAVQKFSPQKPDPELLVWHGHDEALGVLVGSLLVRLDPFDADSPSVKLTVKMKLAKKQPASHGQMLAHCGGPGSGVDCVRSSTGAIAEAFDVFSIDQRGIGEDAQPRLQCSESHLPPEGKESYKLSDFSSCPCAVPDGTPMIGETWADINPLDEASVTDLFIRTTEWGTKCYFAERWQLRGKNGKAYNFLDYVGTQFLAYDIDFLRQAIGAEKISIHGWSYGTLVGSVYSTVFDQRVHRMVLDGNMPPMPKKQELAKGGAESMQKIFGKLLLNCEFTPGCPMKHPEVEYQEIHEAIRAGNFTAPTKKGDPYPLSVGMLHGYMQLRLSDHAGHGWGQVTHTLAQLSPRSPDAAARTRAIKFILDAFCVVKGVPTWYNYGICAGPGTTMEVEDAPMGRPYIEQCIVLSVDLAGTGLWSDAIKHWRSMKAMYGAGLTSFTASVAGMFFWPNQVTPPAPVGSDVPVLIIGNLFDPSTSYSWSQEMARAFPKSVMMTWQGVGHTLPAESYDSKESEQCSQRVLQYLLNGTEPPNGYVCIQQHDVPVNADSN